VITHKRLITALLSANICLCAKQAPTGRRCKVNTWRSTAVSTSDQGLQNNSHNVPAVQHNLQQDDFSPGPDYYQPFRDEWQPREVCGDIQPSSMFAKTNAATLKHVSCAAIVRYIMFVCAFCVTALFV
jgi:hypothetical protein